MQTDYVSDESAAQAKAYETELRKLPPDAGILFIGVKAVPCRDGKSKSFEVRLGTHRAVGQSASVALVSYTFRHEMQRGIKFLVSAYQGISGAARADHGDA
jgi:hypothetical protein